MNEQITEFENFIGALTRTFDFDFTLKFLI